jgi:hypothetical protein
MLSTIFFSSAQSAVRSTDSISFDHLRPPDVNRRLRPPQPPRRSSVCHSPSAPWSHLTSFSSSPSKIAAPYCLPFTISISRNRRHSSSTIVASFPLTVRFPPSYGPIKGTTRPHPLSTAPIPALISPPRAQNHLPIGAQSAASVEHPCVTISAALPPCGTIGENPNNVLSLSLSSSYISR